MKKHCKYLVAFVLIFINFTSVYSRTLRGNRNVQLKRAGNQRVSFKECNLSSSERLDCAHPGITQDECAARECCWMETDEQDVPWCFHSRPTISKLCVADPEERLECGSYGIRKEQCLAMDCCWQPSSTNAPWCYHIKLLPIHEGECGVPATPPNVLSRIINGVEARQHSWPWQISYHIPSWGHNCGGSIINDQWILSAAHCWRGVSETEIVMGLHSQSDQGEETVLELEIDAGFPHEDFTTDPEYELDSDLLLMKLARPINFTDAISPICLPEPGEEFPGGMHAYATGWGATRGRPNIENPDALQQVLLPLVDRDLCNDWYQEMKEEGAGFTWMLADRPITTNMQCAGYEEGGRSACYGDSGGPLVVFKQDRWVQVGVASWVGADICNMEKLPTVYAKISPFINWIQNVISRN